MAECLRLFDVCSDRVAIEVACACLLVDHHAVVGLDRGRCGDAGHKGLCAAGISCDIVELDTADADAEI